jgi:hypothetical protein
MRWGHASTAGILLTIGVLGCGGDQRSGAAPAADSTPALTNDTAAAAASDTATVVRDTAVAAARPETTAAPRDITPAVAAKPVPRRPPRPRPAPAPTPPPADTGRADTAPSPTPAPAATPAPTAQSDTHASTSQPAETTAAATQTAQAEAPLRDAYHQPPRDTVSQQVYDGWKQYNLNCARCHGEDVQGTTIAPHLITSVKPGGPINTKEAFMQTVCAGRPAKGMPAWCPLGMEMPTIEAIYAYVKGRSDAKIHPGRPALRSGG